MKEVKNTMHYRNKHRNAYDFERLIQFNTDLAHYVRPTPYGNLSIDFSNSRAVIALNKALLSADYHISSWNIPEGSLCPSVPGRAEYIHRIADLFDDNIRQNKVRCLDVGVGASCIYPIIGVVEYGWQFVGSDISEESLAWAQHIIDSNRVIKNTIELRFQPESNHIFKNIISPNEYFDISICNPPFYSSLSAYQSANLHKTKKLALDKDKMSSSNFGGKDNELWCLGGEKRFIKAMIKESKQNAAAVGRFTTLVSNKENLVPIIKMLKKMQAVKVEIIPMHLGNKRSRIIAWAW